MRQNLTMLQKSFLYSRFKVVVKIDNVEYGSGSAKSKKEAKELAAKKTWEMIEQEVSKLYDVCISFARKG